MNRLLSFALFLLAALFLTADDYPQLEKTAGLLDTVETMSGSYTREIKAATMKFKTKVQFFEDRKLGRKHLVIHDPNNVRTDIYVRNDSVLVVDKESKSIYYVDLAKSGEILSKMFSLNVFDPIMMIGTMREAMNVEMKKDNKGREVYKFQPDSSNAVFSMILVRYDKKGNPDLMELYDGNNSIVMQTNMKSFKDGLPRSISTSTVMNKSVITETLTITILKINSPIDSLSFYEKNNSYKYVEMEEFLKNGMK